MRRRRKHCRCFLAPANCVVTGVLKPVLTVGRNRTIKVEPNALYGGESVQLLLDREPRAFIYVNDAKRFDPMD